MNSIHPLLLVFGIITATAGCASLFYVLRSMSHDYLSERKIERRVASIRQKFADARLRNAS